MRRVEPFATGDGGEVAGSADQPAELAEPQRERVAAPVQGLGPASRLLDQLYDRIARRRRIRPSTAISCAQNWATFSWFASVSGIVVSSSTS